MRRDGRSPPRFRPWRALGGRTFVVVAFGRVDDRLDGDPQMAVSGGFNPLCAGIDLVDPPDDQRLAQGRRRARTRLLPVRQQPLFNWSQQAAEIWRGSNNASRRKSSTRFV